MKLQYGVIGIACVLMVACSSESESPKIEMHPEKGVEAAAEPETSESPKVLKDKMIAMGALQHFPQGVKSVQAYLGHEFMVGDTPLIPTATVPAADLEKLVGQKVRVEGNWNPGKVIVPDENDLSSRPLGYENVPRGSGIEASSITPVK